jgi:predicted DNA binding CopG/RHH family protein
MTITRRPPRPAASATPPARRRKTPETFIEDAHHAPVPAAEQPAPAPAAVEEDAKTDKKAKSKGKHKDKDKGKHKADKPEKAKRKDKEAVLIRFEDDQLTEMDQRAAALGLSRAAWLRMVVSKALRGKKS